MKEIFTVLSTIYKATESNGSMPSFQADVYSTIRNELYVVYKTDWDFNDYSSLVLLYYHQFLVQIQWNVRNKEEWNPWQVLQECDSLFYSFYFVDFKW